MTSLASQAAGSSAKSLPDPDSNATPADHLGLFHAPADHRNTVGAPAQRALYRTVQEVLTNVRKHAPRATATVELWHDGDDVGVTITNSPPSQPSLPLPGARQELVGLKERADILHGSFESAPTSDGGYRVRLRIPARTD